MIAFGETILPMQTQNPELMYGGAGVMVVGALMAVMSRRGWRNAGNDELQEQLYPDPDQQTSVAKIYNSNARRGAGAWLATGTALAFAGVHASEPFYSEDTFSADEVTIVIEAGQDSRAKDVKGSDGEDLSRIEGSLLSSMELVNDLDGNMSVNIVLAGSTPETILDINSIGDIEDAFAQTSAYMQEFSNAGEPNIASAIVAAEATDPDKIIVITQDGSQETEDAIRENGEGLSIVSLGRPNTPITFLGQEQIADHTSTFGQVNAESVDSTGELAEFLKKNVTEVFKDSRDVPIKGYWIPAAVLAGASWLLGGLRAMRFPRKVREDK